MTKCFSNALKLRQKVAAAAIEGSRCTPTQPMFFCIVLGIKIVPRMRFGCIRNIAHTVSECQYCTYCHSPWTYIKYNRMIQTCISIHIARTISFSIVSSGGMLGDMWQHVAAVTVEGWRCSWSVKQFDSTCIVYQSNCAAISTIRLGLLPRHQISIRNQLKPIEIYRVSLVLSRSNEIRWF